jgi:RNA polymerase sigma-70 factor, ECF subfamily
MQKETEIVQKAKLGNKDALEKLYTENFKGLYVYVRHRISNDYTAEDIVSESFVKAFESIKSFKGESSFKTWVYTIARNKIIDWYRKKGKEISLQEEDFVKNEKVYINSKSTSTQRMKKQ